MLPENESKVLFDDKLIDFGFPKWQLERILELWRYGKSVTYISKSVRRNHHEVFMALYQFWMEWKIDDIEKAFGAGSKLLQGEVMRNENIHKK